MACEATSEGNGAACGWGKGRLSAYETSDVEGCPSGLIRPLKSLRVRESASDSRRRRYGVRRGVVQRQVTALIGLCGQLRIQQEPASTKRNGCKRGARDARGHHVGVAGPSR